MPTTERASVFADSYCRNLGTLRQEVFTVNSHVKVPMGLRVDETAPYVERVSYHSEEVSSKLIRILASSKYRSLAEGEIAPFRAERYGGLANEKISDMSDGGGLRLAWIGRREFVTWDASHFPGEDADLILPDGRSVLVRAWRCSAFFKSFGYNDGSGCNGSFIPRQGIFHFIADSGFNLGDFVDSRYFVVPSRELAFLCKKAGRGERCLGAEPVAGVGDIQRKSSESLDLIMDASTSVSRKVEKDWIVSRVEFDPTLMCRYAKPISDLYTQ